MNIAPDIAEFHNVKTSTMHVRMAENDHALHVDLAIRVNEPGVFPLLLRVQHGIIALRVNSLAYVYPNNREDLWQQARLGLHLGYQRFDPAKRRGNPMGYVMTYVFHEVNRWHIERGACVKFPTYLVERGHAPKRRRSVIGLTDIFEASEAKHDIEERIARAFEALQVTHGAETEPETAQDLGRSIP